MILYNLLHCKNMVLHTSFFPEITLSLPHYWFNYSSHLRSNSICRLSVKVFITALTPHFLFCSKIILDFQSFSVYLHSSKQICMPLLVSMCFEAPMFPLCLWALPFSMFNILHPCSLHFTTLIRVFDLMCSRSWILYYSTLFIQNNSFFIPFFISHPSVSSHTLWNLVERFLIFFAFISQYSQKLPHLSSLISFTKSLRFFLYSLL